MNRKAQSGLARRFAALEARLDAIEGKDNPPDNALAGHTIGGVSFDASGNVIPDPNAVPHEQRVAERRDDVLRSHEAAAADRKYFGGCYKMHGLWRDPQGRQLSDTDAAKMEARAKARDAGEPVQATEPQTEPQPEQAQASPREAFRREPVWRKDRQLAQGRQQPEQPGAVLPGLEVPSPAEPEAIEQQPEPPADAGQEGEPNE
jgi:hypothetical protein